MSSHTFDILKEKAVARDRGLTVELRRLQGVFNAKAKSDRNLYYDRLADDAERELRQHDLHPAYRAIQCLSGRGTSKTGTSINKSDKSPCTTSGEVH